MLTHIKLFFRDLRHTGSILPSSRVFAREMTRSLRCQGPARRILEVGPGIGPMTRRIVELLRPDDSLDVVEINPEFARRVDREHLEPARRRLPGTHIAMHCGPIQSVNLSDTYDVIISSLPHNNFEVDLIGEIMGCYRRLLARNGELCIFEYAGMRRIGRLVATGTHKRRLEGIARILQAIDRHPDVNRCIILRNFPPAVKRSLSLAAIEVAVIAAV